MRVRYSPDFLSGLFFCGAAIIGIALSSRLQLGSASRMGAGFFPLGLSIILLILGSLVLARAWLRKHEDVGDVSWRPFFAILGAVSLFSVFVDRLGFVLSAAILIAVARLAGGPFKPIEVAILAVGLIILSAGIFVVGLKLPMRLLPA